MEKEQLLFYEPYEEFYDMASHSKAFAAFCREAFGEDFSQDGFSDTEQINMILKYIPDRCDTKILDIGCGNGKMLEYLHSKTGAEIYGFDYSDNAVADANKRCPEAHIEQGVIGQKSYPAGSFDVITAMDSIYFAPDMDAFIRQVLGWLKDSGVFFVGYQEGDVIPKTENASTAVLTKILKANGIDFEFTDITRQTYDLLCRKRACAEKFEAALKSEGYGEWFDLLMMQTDCTLKPFEKFSKEMARYIYVIRKPI